jgi:4-amino-4-deoxy-L-arabinose transferase-like glycosyltransferase
MSVGAPAQGRALIKSWDADTRWDRLALGGIVAGVLLRALFVFILHPPHDYVYSDMQGYVTRAMEVARGHAQVPRDLAFYPPGTHLLLAASFKLFGTGPAGLHWADAAWFALSAVSPAFVWRLVRELLGPAAGAVTAVLAALAPLFILYAGFFTSETPSLALLSGALWLGYRARSAPPLQALSLSVAGGLLGGLLVATRPQFILNLLLVAAALLQSARTRWRAVPGFAVGLIGVVAVVVAINSNNAGHVTGFSENSGLTFFQAQCNIHRVSTGRPPGFGYVFENPVAFSLRRGHDAYFPNHVGWDSGFFFRQGLDCIGSDGLGHVPILARDVIDLTATSIPWPLMNEIALSRIGDIANVLYSAALVALTLLVPLARRHWEIDERTRSGTNILLAHLAMVIPVAVVFGAEPRYRVPYDIFGLALMGWLIAGAITRRRAPPVIPRASG